MGVIKKYTSNLFLLFLILVPFVDLFTSLFIRYITLPISLGMIVKGLLIAWLFYYLLFKTKSKYKKISLIYICMLLVFSIFYFITKEDFQSVNFIFSETIYMFKYMYLPFFYICCLNYFDDHKEVFNKLPNCLMAVALVYSFLLLIPYLTGTAFASYSDGMSLGFVGWFYAANEMGIILLILYSFIYKVINFNAFIGIIILALSSFTIVLIGTKVSNIGLIIISIIFLILSFFQRSKANKKQIFICLLVLGINVSIVINGFLSDNVRNSYDYHFNAGENIDKIPNDNDKIPNDNDKNDGKENLLTNDEEKNKYFNSLSDIFGFNTPRIVDVILSSRSIYFVNTYNIYYERPVIEKAFGIGFTNRKSINNENIEKLVEMDFIDIFIRYGFVGFAIYMMPILFTLFIGLKKIFDKSFYYKSTIILYVVILLLTCSVAFLAGHVFGAPSVAIYMSSIMCLITLFDSKSLEENYEKDNYTSIT